MKMCYSSVRSNVCSKMEIKKIFAHLFIAEFYFSVTISTLHIALLAVLLLVGIPAQLLLPLTARLIPFVWAE